MCLAPSLRTAARTTAAISEEVVSFVQQSRSMIIAWSRAGFPTGGIESYDFAISFELPTPAAMDMSAHAVPEAGIDLRNSWAVDSLVAAKVQIVRLKGDPQLPDEMWIRPRTFGALFGEAFGLVAADGINPMCARPSFSPRCPRARAPRAIFRISVCVSVHLLKRWTSRSPSRWVRVRLSSRAPPRGDGRLDWRPDGQQYCAVYLGVGRPGLVCPEPGGAEYSYVPSTMSMWVR